MSENERFRGKRLIEEVFPFLNNYYSNEGGYFLEQCPEFDPYRDDFNSFMYGGTFMAVDGKLCYYVYDVARFANRF